MIRQSTSAAILATIRDYIAGISGAASQGAVAERMGISRRRVRTLEASVQRELKRELRTRGVHDTSLTWALQH